MANSPFAGLLNENDKVLRQIWDEILSDPEVVDAFHAGNSYDILINIVREKFDEKNSFWKLKDIIILQKSWKRNKLSVLHLSVNLLMLWQKEQREIPISLMMKNS